MKFVKNIIHPDLILTRNWLIISDNIWYKNKSRVMFNKKLYNQLKSLQCTLWKCDNWWKILFGFKFEKIRFCRICPSGRLVSFWEKTYAFFSNLKILVRLRGWKFERNVRLDIYRIWFATEAVFVKETNPSVRAKHHLSPNIISQTKIPEHKF